MKKICVSSWFIYKDEPHSLTFIFHGFFNFMRRAHHCDVSHMSLCQFPDNILKDSHQHMWEVCYNKQILCSWNPDSGNHTAQIFWCYQFWGYHVLLFSCSVCYSSDRYNFPSEAVINTLVTGVLIVGCEISVDAFKTNDHPLFIAC